jgi:hypothetical protein
VKKRERTSIRQMRLEKQKKKKKRRRQRRVKKQRASIEKQREQEGKLSPVYPTLPEGVHQIYGFSKTPNGKKRKAFFSFRSQKSKGFFFSTYLHLILCTQTSSIRRYSFQFFFLFFFFLAVFKLGICCLVLFQNLFPALL